MGRTSLLIRLSHEDAARIREGASSEYRSVSGYLLYVLERSFRIEEVVVRGAADSGRCRSAFRDDADHYSVLIPIRIPL